MSKMKELYDKVSADKALQEAFFCILNDAEKTGEEATKESLVQFAKGEGFEITVEEMQEFFKDLSENISTELSAAELDMVAGGKATIGLFYSIIGLGIACAIMSIVEAADKDDVSCQRLMNGDIAFLRYDKDGSL